MRQRWRGHDRSLDSQIKQECSYRFALTAQINVSSVNNVKMRGREEDNEREINSEVMRETRD